jgi:hypothetical protein
MNWIDCLRRMRYPVSASLTFLLVVFLVNGCASYQSTIVGVDGMARVRFKTHAVATACANTYGCTIRYGSLAHGDRDSSVLSPPLRTDLLTSGMSGEIGIKNFPDPALIEWRSSDGIPHRAIVDIGAIFKDQFMVHSVPMSAVDRVSESPEVLIVVDDKTIRVYLKIFVWLKEPAIPGNRFSFWKREAHLAFEKTYL